MKLPSLQKQKISQQMENHPSMHFVIVWTTITTAGI